MKVDRTVRRVVQGERRAGRDVGHALMKGNRTEWSEFRARCAAADPEDEYAEGYRDALLDVVAAYSAGWSALAAKWPEGWEESYIALADGHRTVTEIATFTGASLPTASRRLAGMADSGLLTVTTDPRDSRSKLYSRATPEQDGEG